MIRAVVLATELLRVRERQGPARRPSLVFRLTVACPYCGDVHGHAHSRPYGWPAPRERLDVVLAECEPAFEIAYEIVVSGGWPPERILRLEREIHPHELRLYGLLDGPAPS